MRVTEPVYYGCARRALGHFPFAPGMRRIPGLDQWRFDGRHLDGGFCPPGSATEGEATLTLVDASDEPATILSFWDRTVDRRPGSHSTFLLPGSLDFDGALDAARSAFPEVFARLGFVVLPYRPRP